jgi:hypothetical protein
MSNTSWPGGDDVPDVAAYVSASEQCAHKLMELRQGALWASPSESADMLWALAKFAALKPDTTTGAPSITLNERAVAQAAQTGNTGTTAVLLSGDTLHAGTNWLRLGTTSGQALYYSLTLRATR